MGKTLKITLWSIGGLIVLGLIFFILSPEDSGITGNVVNLPSDSVEVEKTEPTQQEEPVINLESEILDPSIESCKQDILDYAEFATIKESINYKVVFIQIEKFTDPLSVKVFLEEWDYKFDYTKFRELYEFKIGGKTSLIKYDDIVVALIKTEETPEEDPEDLYISILKPIICIDGKMTQQSKDNRFFY